MIVINIVQAKLPWPPGSWELIGLRQFNKKQYGQVVQLTGNVRYAEGNGEIELFLQFDVRIIMEFVSGRGAMLNILPLYRTASVAAWL